MFWEYSQTIRWLVAMATPPGYVTSFTYKGGRIIIFYYCFQIVSHYVCVYVCLKNKMSTGIYNVSWYNLFQNFRRFPTFLIDPIILPTQSAIRLKIPVFLTFEKKGKNLFIVYTWVKKINLAF